MNVDILGKKSLIKMRLLGLFTFVSGVPENVEVLLCRMCHIYLQVQNDCFKAGLSYFYLEGQSCDKRGLARRWRTLLSYLCFSRGRLQSILNISPSRGEQGEVGDGGDSLVGLDEGERGDNLRVG